MLKFIQYWKTLAHDFSEINKRGALIIDVRTPAAYHKGHIAGSLNIALEQLNAIIDYLKQENATVITCCESGTRSSIATGMLMVEGIEAYDGGSWYALENQLAK